jgi:antitoxin (DNA-binding transcriptional repressor) of toxin-antitoxin stability system
MTIIDPMKTINVNVATLKARLSEYLRLVRKGTKVVVLDHKHPVATLGPIELGNEVDDLGSIKPSDDPRLKGFFPVRNGKRPFSSLEILLEDRKKR